MAVPYAPTNPTAATGTTSISAQSRDVSNVRDIQNFNNLIMDDIEARERGQDVINLATSILEDSRGSTIEQEDVNKVLDIRAKYATRNETTF